MNAIKQTKMKEKVRKKYLRKIGKLLEIKLKKRNLIKGINTWTFQNTRCGHRA